MAPVRTVHHVGQRGLRFWVSGESCDFIVLKSVVRFGENLMSLMISITSCKLSRTELQDRDTS